MGDIRGPNPIGDSMSAERIFYFCYSNNFPRDRQKDTYRHVDILNKHGFDAHVYHRKSGFRLTWFENETRVVDAAGFRQLFNPGSDYVVLPEDLGIQVLRFPGRKVIFDNGLYRSASAIGIRTPDIYPCHSVDVAAVFTVSDHRLQHLQFAYPHLRIYKVYSGICTDTFRYRPLHEKKSQIATAPKAVGSISALYHLLQARSAAALNKGHRFNWIVLSEQSERERAEILADSLIFVFLGTDEGVPRLTLEGQLSGCIVVATDAGPLKECVARECLFATGDLLGMARLIERVMDSFPSHLVQWEELARKGLSLATEHSLERQERSVILAWEHVLRSQSHRGTSNSAVQMGGHSRDQLNVADLQLRVRHYHALLKQLIAGDRFSCPFCLKTFGRFLPYSSSNAAYRRYAIVGAGFRPNARCPTCNSRDRERLVYLYLRGPGWQADSWRRILHIAPEQNLGRFLADAATKLYVSGDLAANGAQLRFDLTAAPFSDSNFDLIVCNHVLANIKDDQTAMSEVHRMLAPDGVAILQVPISRRIRRTYEDSSLQSEPQRLSAFGNETQVRIYGRDYAERLGQVGFNVREIRASEWLSRDAIRRYALIPRESLFVCRRASYAHSQP